MLKKYAYRFLIGYIIIRDIFSKDDEKMQKKVIMLIVGYILLICVVGAGLLIKRQFDNIPVVDDELIQELLDSTDMSGMGEEEESEPSQDSEKEIVDQEEPESNYWGNYYQETNEEKRSPVISEIQKKITTGDKLRIMKIIKNDLSSDDIKYILSLSKNGFTSKEQEEVKSILQEKVGEKEKQELKDILLKYL